MSTLSRTYTGEAISEPALNTILQAANASPVGMGKYESMHLTAVNNKHLLNELNINAGKAFNVPDRDLLYNAPALIIVSTSADGDENIRYSNAAIMAHSMVLAVTDLGVGCYQAKATPHNSDMRIAQSGILTDETKSAVNTLCIHEHFCEIWWNLC